jgi:hypothetical protein
VKLYASLSDRRACVSASNSKDRVASKREGRRAVQGDAPGGLVASEVLAVAPSQSEVAAIWRCPREWRHVPMRSRRCLGARLERLWFVYPNAGQCPRRMQPPTRRTTFTSTQRRLALYITLIGTLLLHSRSFRGLASCA